MNDCGGDVENMPITWPFCCKKHMKEIRLFMRNICNRDTMEIIYK